MVTFRAPANSEHYLGYPQMIVFWDGKQVGVASELTKRSLSYRWQFTDLHSDLIAIDQTLMGLAGKIKDYMETWESHDSIYDGLAAAKALPHLMEL